MSETDTYRLIVPRKNDSELLMSIHENLYHLPTVVVPKNRRTAHHITSHIREQWGLVSVCRGNDSLYDHAEKVRCQIIQPCGSNWEPSDGLRWVARSDLNPSTYDIEELAIIEKALEPYALRGPFASAGWLDDLIRWMEPHLRAAGHSLTGNLEQLNSSEFFNLIWFETNRGAVWFKATGKPNLTEFPITVGLAKRYPRFLPRLLATRPEWNGWLMEDFGSALRDSMGLAHWKDAVVTLASLQIETSGNVDDLLYIGCLDMRIPRLLEDIDVFFETVSELMGRQPKTPPPILSQSELRLLARKLREICSELAFCGFPDSLQHGDFSPGSILVTSEQCVFTDWAEAYVGHPFITFEQMLARLRLTYPELAHWQDELRTSYAQRWAAVVPPKKISEAFRFTAVVALLSFALARSRWKDPSCIAEPHVAKYLRSYARQMNREIEQLESSGFLCFT